MKAIFKVNLPPQRPKRDRGFVQILLLILIMLGVTTYGIVVFQARVVSDSSRQDSVNANTLETARIALLDHAVGEGMQNYQTRAHILPDLDYFYLDTNVSGLFNYRVSRPGQFPCPDVAGADSLDEDRIGRDGSAWSTNDLRLDGIADYAPFYGDVVGDLSYCSSERDFLPLVQGSRTGRLPWAEYFDYTGLIRGVDSPYPLIDRNSDRLWYSVSRNVVNTDQPINANALLRQDDGWLTLRVAAFQRPDETSLRQVGFASDLTITNLAALVISPGTSSPAFPRQFTENELYGPGNASLTIHNDIAEQYLDDINTTLVLPSSTVTVSVSNNDADNVFVTGSGDPLDHIDQIAHISKEELVTRFDQIPVDDNLDQIADLLANYYDKYGSLPDPATAERTNTDFITRAFGRSSDGININLYDPTASSGDLNRLDDIGIRGGRVEYALNPISNPSSTQPAMVIDIDNRTEQLISGLTGAEIPDIFVPLDTTVAVTSASFHSFEIPLNDLLYPGTPYTPVSTQEALGRWQTVIPAGEPFRAAAPFYITRDPSHSGAPVSAVTLDTQSELDYGSITGEYNLLFGDLVPSLMRDLAPLGYAVLMPSGTWMVADADITISGTEAQLVDPVTDRRPSPGIAFEPNINAASTVQFGLSRDLNEITTDPPAVASKSPLVTGNHGLLPTPLLPNQKFGEQPFTSNRGLFLIPTPIVPTNDNINAIVIDPLGAVGSFPAEVTLHPQANIITTALDAPVTSSIEPLAFDPIPNISANSYTYDSIVAPYPFFNGLSDLVFPGQIIVDGPIVIPVGAKFFYPSGTRLHLDGRIPSIDVSLNPPRLFAHLPAGTILHDVRIHSRAGSLMPDGQTVTVIVDNGVSTTLINASSTEQAAVFSRITLVNGGQLSYSSLGYYDGTEISPLPQNAAQAAFKVEGKFGLINNNASLEDFLTNSTPNRFLARAQDSYLYPALGSFEARSRLLSPTPSITIRTVGGVTVREPEANTVVHAIENPLARSEIVAYSFGTGQPTTITLLQENSRLNLNLTSTVSRYSLIDQYGLGIEFERNSNADGAIIPSIPGTQITLDFGQGVTMQANPGRMFLTTNVDGTVNLLFNQFGAPESNTPLALSYVPELTLGTLALTRDGAITTISVDARMTELALNLDSSTSIALPNFNPATQYATPSDRFAIGNITVNVVGITLPDLSTATRVYARYDTDAVLFDGSDSELLPAATQAEFGLLEFFDIGTDRNTRHMVPGARIFAGTGYYPIPSNAAVRPYRDLISIDGPESITLSVVSAGLLPPTTFELPSFDRTSFPINTDLTVNLTANAAVPQTIVLRPADLMILSRPKLAIPGGQDAVPLRLTTDIASNNYYDFTDAAIFLADQIEHVSILTGTTTTLSIGILPTELETNVIPSTSITIGLPFTSTADIMDTSFTFVLDDGGIVSNGRAGVTPLRTLSTIQPRQVMRMRFGINEGIAGEPDLLPLIDLSWSNRERSDIRHSDFAPDNLVFAQNNPLFYAVAEACRSRTKRNVDDCTDARQGGLSVQILPGEQVRLPDDEIAPPGLIIHGFRNNNLLPQPFTIIEPDPADNFGLYPFTPFDQASAGNVTVTVAGIRIREDGAIEELEFSEDSFSSLTSSGSTLTFAVGTTLVLVPGQTGIMFRYEPVDQTLYAMSQPQPTDRFGYREPLTLIQGGFTANREIDALHKITVAVGQTISLATDTRIVGSYDIPENTGFIELAPGSIFADTTPRSASNYRLIGDYTNLTVTLNSNAVLLASGQQLPTVTLSGGPNLTLNPSTAQEESTSAALNLSPGSVITITGTNRAIQAQLSGSSIAFNLTNSSTAPANYYVRTYNSPAATDGRRFRDLAIPSRVGSYGTNNDDLSAYDPLIINLASAAQQLPVDCWMCGLEATGVDISSGDPLNPIFNPATVTVTLSRKIAPPVTVSTIVEPADMLVHSIVTMTIDTTGITDSMVNLRINDFDSTFVYGDVTLLELPDNIEIANDSLQNDITDHYANTLSIAPNSAAVLDTLAATTFAGIALDRFGATEPLLITIGNAVELEGPLALYSPSDTEAFPGLATLTPALSAANREQAQFFLDNPETRLQISGDFQLGIQLTDENLVVNGINIPPGSILYPQIGLLLPARELPIDEATVVPLVSFPSGLFGNIVGGGAAGRPRTIDRNILFEPPASGGSGSLGIAIESTNVTTNLDLNVAVSASMYFSHPSAILRDLDIRRSDAVLYGPDFPSIKTGTPTTPPASKSLGSNLRHPSIGATDLVAAPALHQIIFPPAGDLTLHPPASRSADRVNEYTFPTGTDLQASIPTGGSGHSQETVDISGYRFVDNIEPPGSLLINGERFEVDIQAEAMTLESQEVDRLAAFSQPIRQYLWTRTRDDVTITNTLTSEEVELPASTVINPILGTYLSPEYRLMSGASQITLRIGTTSPAIAGSRMIFTHPVMMMPRGAILDVGTQSVSFTDVKGLIAHSAQPLRSDISCAAYPGPSLAVNQLDEGRSTTLLIRPEYETSSSRPPGIPATLGSILSDYGHPCLLLDFEANTDLDNSFIFTSKPLHDTSSFEVLANDRMRMIGGKLQL